MVKLVVKKDECPFKHFDCFARQPNRICRALHDTDFNGKDCPFYKTREEYERKRDG